MLSRDASTLGFAQRRAHTYHALLRSPYVGHWVRSRFRCLVKGGGSERAHVCLLPGSVS